MKYSTLLTIFCIFIVTDIAEIKRLKKQYQQTQNEKIRVLLKFQKIGLAAVCIGAAFSLFGMIFLR